MLLEEMVTRRVSEGFSVFPSLTRRVTKQVQLLPAALVLIWNTNGFPAVAPTSREAKLHRR